LYQKIKSESETFPEIKKSGQEKENVFEEYLKFTPKKKQPKTTS